MSAKPRRKNIFCQTACITIALFIAAAATQAESNIDDTDKYAWSENAGWINFKPAHGGASVVWGGYGSPSYLSGYAWAENIGWIQLGSDAGGPYKNTDENDWGVNILAGGRLDGFAWAENAGWINFKPTHGQVTINTADGRFDGFAWAENIGWIHFKNVNPVSYNVRTTAPFPGGSVIKLK